MPYLLQTTNLKLSDIAFPFLCPPTKLMLKLLASVTAHFAKYRLPALLLHVLRDHGSATGHVSDTSYRDWRLRGVLHSLQAKKQGLYHKIGYGRFLPLLVTSCHFLPRPVTSCHFLPLPLASYHFRSLPFTSCHFLPLATSCHFLPHPVTSCHCLSLPATSCHFQFMVSPIVLAVNPLLYWLRTSLNEPSIIIIIIIIIIKRNTAGKHEIKELQKTAILGFGQYFGAWIWLFSSCCVYVTNLLKWTVFTQHTNNRSKSTTG